VNDKADRDDELTSLVNSGAEVLPELVTLIVRVLQLSKQVLHVSLNTQPRVEKIDPSQMNEMGQRSQITWHSKYAVFKSSSSRSDI